MLKIAHRINTIDQLKAVDPKYGVEIDLRSQGEKLILHHDPFVEGTDFEEWLSHYNHSLIILNTKEEGLEERLLETMKAHDIENYFFLDLSNPFLIKYGKLGLKKAAVRYSEYEPVESVKPVAHMFDWLWIDCFNDLYLLDSDYEYLSKNFKLCLVSPELQGHPKSWIEEFKTKLGDKKLDAVCTKFPELW